jgi:hypothetical protein
MNTFRSEIMDLVKSSVPAKEPARDIDITIRYFGWDGQGGCSMQLVGEKYKLTRERVRQVTGKIVRHMAEQADEKLFILPNLLSMINALSPASADRIELLLKDHGLGEDRLEGVLQAAKQFNRPGKYMRISEEFGARFVILPDMEGSAEKIMAKAQKLISHLGYIHIETLLGLLPGIPKIAAFAFIRDVLSLRDDVVWLDADKEWVWLKEAPRNRLITCLSKMLTMFSSTTLDNIRAGVNRYFRKGDATSPTISGPDSVLRAFLTSWGQASCSAASIVRKTSAFEPSIEPLEMEESIARLIMSRSGKMAREKEMENALVPEINGETHGKKYNFSIALNYSPLLMKGEKRGQYVTTGTF